MFTGGSLLPAKKVRALALMLWAEIPSRGYLHPCLLTQAEAACMHDASQPASFLSNDSFVSLKMAVRTVSSTLFRFRMTQPALALRLLLTTATTPDPWPGPGSMARLISTRGPPSVKGTHFTSDVVTTPSKYRTCPITQERLRSSLCGMTRGYRAVSSRSEQRPH